MGTPAVRIQDAHHHSPRTLHLVRGGQLNTPQAALAPSLPNEIIVLGLILSTLQILDGVLTGIGMAHYGTTMEGNILLRSLMSVMGYLPALILVKGASIALIVLLCQQTTKISWLKPALYGVVGLYVIGAVVPWTYILETDLLA
jgi:hypothetical protein